MTDIHSHIIFNVDDGCFKKETSLDILKEEAEGGVTDFILTPHTDNFNADPVKINAHLEELKKMTQEAGLNINLYLGAEVSPELPPDAFIKKGINITMGHEGKYVLLGPTFGSTFNKNSFNEIIYDLQLKGKIPIIAHPERMIYFQEDPEILVGFLHGGCLLQVNAASLWGKYGEHAKEFVHKIIKLKWASFAATDNHRPHGFSIMKKAYEVISQEFSPAEAEKLLVENPRCVLENKALCNYDFKEWEPEKKKKKFLFFTLK